MSSIIASDKESFELQFDADIYSIEVCKKACYALMSHISCKLEKNNNKIIITATPNSNHPESSEQIKALLMDELLDYSLRETIAKKTEDYRNIILSNAFSKSKLSG